MNKVSSARAALPGVSGKLAASPARTIRLACAIAVGVALGWPAAAGAQAVTEFAIPTTPSSFPLGIVKGPVADGNLWFVEQYSNKIAKMSTTGTITEFLIPTVDSGACCIVLGSDNNLWFTESSGNNIAKIT